MICCSSPVGGGRQGWKLQDLDGTLVRAPGRSRLRLKSGAGLRDPALAGMGIALLPHLMVSADIRMRRLEQVLAAVNCADVPIVALYPHRRHHESRVSKLIGLLADNLC